ncbi:L-idonate 5-dehydrogenase [Labrys portucalensis]|uniref:L-idonate 5-dehydrogenase n=1 Tax=Labrys neptuniae TaxID=376174 RepID=A0ABV6ZG24_9HYPH
MRALVIHGPKDLRLEERDPGPLQNGQVMVRVQAGGICGSDLHYYNHGGFGVVRLKEPMILGHEVSGEIVEVAADVGPLRRGDRVAVNPSRPCGHCRYCLQGLPNHCMDMHFYGSAMRMPHVQGAFRQLLVCDAVQCEVGHNAGADELALVEPFSVALHAISRAGSLLGRRILVTGCGPIGALVVAAARFHGAAEIIVTDIVDEPLAIAARLGADRTINAAQAPEALAALAVDKGQVDVMFECSGNEKALRAGLEAMRPRGIIVQLGLGGDVAFPQNLVVAKELSVVGSFRFHAEFALATQLIDTGKIDLRPLLTGSFALDDAVSAFALANDRRRAMKVQLSF